MDAGGTFMKNFTERLAYAMARKQINQADLSRASGIGKGSISNYLSGRVEPKDGQPLLSLSNLLWFGCAAISARI